MSRRLTMLAVLSLPLLTSCALLTPSPGIKTAAEFCLIAEPITFDRLHDTLPTIEQVKEYDAIGRRLCGWKGVETPAQGEPTWGQTTWGSPQ